MSVSSTGISTRLLLPPQCSLCESELEKVHDNNRNANYQYHLEGAKRVYDNNVHGIYRGFNRQRLESRGRLEHEGIYISFSCP